MIQNNRNAFSFRIMIFFILLLGSAFLSACQAASLAQASLSSSVPLMPSSAELESKWGIKPIRIALTASGGMVDLRYQVIKPEIADALHADLIAMPYIIAADGTEVRLDEMIHQNNYEAGRTYYILYPNAGNAVKSNTEVTLVVGDMKLEHIPVR